MCSGPEAQGLILRCCQPAQATEPHLGGDADGQPLVLLVRDAHSFHGSPVSQTQQELSRAIWGRDVLHYLGAACAEALLLQLLPPVQRDLGMKVRT